MSTALMLHLLKHTKRFGTWANGIFSFFESNANAQVHSTNIPGIDSMNHQKMMEIFFLFNFFGFCYCAAPHIQLFASLTRIKFDNWQSISWLKEFIFYLSFVNCFHLWEVNDAILDFYLICGSFFLLSSVFVFEPFGTVLPGSRIFAL